MVPRNQATPGNHNALLSDAQGSVLAWAQDLLDWTVVVALSGMSFHVANISVALDLANEAVAEATMIAICNLSPPVWPGKAAFALLSELTFLIYSMLAKTAPMFYVTSALSSSKTTPSHL